MDSSTSEQDTVVGQSSADYILPGPSTISPDKNCSLMNIRRGELWTLEEKECDTGTARLPHFPFLEQ